MMAENDAGGGEYPWYHPAYDSLVQETPYRFEDPRTLTDPKELRGELRGEPRRRRRAAVPDQPLGRHEPGAAAVERREGQQAPRCSSAGSSVCEEERGLAADLIAVDFYREGDVFEVAEDLNEARAVPDSP